MGQNRDFKIERHAPRGVQGQKVRKQDFEITSDPKGPQSGPTFWSGFKNSKITGKGFPWHVVKYISRAQLMRSHLVVPN